MSHRRHFNERNHIVTFKSVNPVDGTVFAEVAGLTLGELEAALQETALAAPLWADTAYAVRCDLMRRAATVLRGHMGDFSRMMALSMVSWTSYQTREWTEDFAVKPSVASLLC